jgi:4-amino-4-deoxy-L-arabinose transferase-like glycosyltransferase
MKISIPYYIIVVGLFLGICAPTLWSDGMFIDGLYYAAIANNLSGGIGSFWYLHHTEFSFPIFHEHPPLAMGLQSILFSIFGDSIYIERMYSFFTFIFTGAIIHLIWGEITSKELKYLSWIPMFFWIIIPLNSWACSNNMLENTMNVFVSLSVLFCLKSLKKSKLKNIFFAGIFLSLAFLSKGFTGLFPLSIFFWYFIIFKEMKIPEMCSRSMTLLLFSITPFILLFFIYPPAIDSIQQYINKQVVKSIEHIQTVDSRFYIIKKLILELLPPLTLCLLIFYFSIKKGFKVALQEKKLLLFFILLGFSGVLPVMISMKQSGFYILTTFPFFGIAFGILVAPFIASLISKKKSIIYMFGIFILISSLLLSVQQIGRIGRDKELVEDIQLLLTIIPANSTISIENNMSKNYQLIGYFARYGNVSLNHKDKLNYHINFKSNKEEKENYREIKLNTKTLILYFKTK